MQNKQRDDVPGGKKTGVRTVRAAAISLAGKRVSFRFPLTLIFYCLLYLLFIRLDDKILI